MPRPKILINPKRVNIVIEESLHAAAVRKAAEYGFTGGFSEYVSRLLVTDLSHQPDAARHPARSIEVSSREFVLPPRRSAVSRWPVGEVTRI